MNRESFIQTWIPLTDNFFRLAMHLLGDEAAARITDSASFPRSTISNPSSWRNSFTRRAIARPVSFAAASCGTGSRRHSVSSSSNRFIQVKDNKFGSIPEALPPLKTYDPPEC